MTWKDGHICVAHFREPWIENQPPIFVQSTLETLKGREGTVERSTYMAAKFQFSTQAAEEVLRRCIRKSTVDSLIAHTIAGGLDAKIIMPHPAFDDISGGEQLVSKTTIPRNALPFAYAAFLKRTLGCQVDEEIVQIARVGRTNLSKMPRFLFQPSFGGAVRAGQTYILADDVVSTGGTFAALRSYIMRNGGSVVFATVIANGNGENQPLSIEKQTINRLVQSFGEGLDLFWTETIGHGISCLTEVEGQYLVEWSNAKQAEGCRAGEPLLQRLRDRIDAAAAKNG
jgi:hypothetical protein